jgi:hypothetical protein
VAVRYLLLGVVLAVAACQAAEPHLGTTEEHLVVASPATFEFGFVEVGATSAAHSTTVAPASQANDDMVLAVTASCPDFSIEALGLPANVYRTCDGGCQTCVKPRLVACVTLDYVTYHFNATFHPTVAGAQSCVVSVMTMPTIGGATTTRTVTLSGTGTVPPQRIGVGPTAVAFGDVRRNTSSGPATVTVSSLGGAALTVSAVTISAGFTITGGDTAAHALPAGATEAYTITCDPTTLGPTSGSLTIASGDAVAPSLDVPLSCNGIDSALDINPSPAVLAATRVGEPASTTVTLVNSGTAAMSLEAVAITGADLTMTSAAPPPGTMLAAGGSLPITVAFGATAKGDASATLSVTFDGGQVRTSQISARALLATISLSPDGQVDFGPVCGGQTKEQLFTILGNGDGPFVVSALAAPPAPFSLTMVSPAALPASVVPQGGNTVTFKVGVAPVASGPVTGAVTVTTDIPGGAPHEIGLAAEALAAGVTATPDTVDLGSSAINTTTIGQAVHLANCNPDTLTWTNQRLEGADAADFAIVSQPIEATIAPAGSASWLIVLQAHARGVKTATFAVDYPGGTATVQLLGEGLDPSQIDGGPGRGSYYACSAGRGAAGWPVLLVIGLVVGRRRSAPRRR